MPRKGLECHKRILRAYMKDLGINPEDRVLVCDVLPNRHDGAFSECCKALIVSCRFSFFSPITSFDLCCTCQVLRIWTCCCVHAS